jgi:hypothetical protein
MDGDRPARRGQQGVDRIGEFKWKLASLLASRSHLGGRGKNVFADLPMRSAGSACPFERMSFEE